METHWNRQTGPAAVWTTRRQDVTSRHSERDKVNSFTHESTLKEYNPLDRRWTRRNPCSRWDSMLRSCCEAVRVEDPLPPPGPAPRGDNLPCNPRYDDTATRSPKRR